VRHLLAALCLAFTGCAGRGVVAEGWAPLGPDGTEGARRRALVQAQKTAVERSEGVALTSRLRMKDGAAVEQSLTARSAGRVGRYEVLSEGPAADGWRTTIRAVVEKGGPPNPVEVALSETMAPGLAAGAREGLRYAGLAVGGGSGIVLDGAAVEELAPTVSGWPARRARVSMSARRGAETLAQATAEGAAAGPMEQGLGALAVERAARACARKLAAQLASDELR
jgi:hypothetical protein